ncbi:type III secretion system cytoplasmic ring protein SctQ [Allorhizobium undicola]
MTLRSGPRAVQRRHCDYGGLEPAVFGLGKYAASFRPIDIEVAKDKLAQPQLLRLACGNRRIDVLLAQDNVQLLAGRLEPLLDWNEADPQARAAILEYFFADAIEAFENRCGFPVSFERIAALEGDAASVNFALELAWNGLNIPLALQLDAESHAAILRWASLLPRRRLTAINVPVSIRRAHCTLTLAELRALRIGEGIVLGLRQAEQAVAVTADRYAALCRIGPEGAVLDGPLLGAPTGMKRHFMMEEQSDDTDKGQALTAVSDIPIRLVFEAGRLDMPLAELERIGEGHVFPLDRPLSDAVDILANGRRIGRGEIVTVDGLTAVRVTALDN